VGGGDRRSLVVDRLVLRATGDPDVDLRLGSVGVAALLGWVSIGAVLLGLATGLPVRHQDLVLATTVAAAVGHAALGLLPWSRLLGTRRGRLLLDLWAGALVAGVVGLVLTAGGASRLDLLFFLVVPWLATLQEGRRRVAWLAAAALAFGVTLAVAPAPLPTAEALLHAVLVAGAAILAALLSSAARRQARGRAAAIRRAELEGAMLAEGHHRVKNSLQVVADLLLLGRPAEEPQADAAGGASGQRRAASGEAAAFDQAAARIRAIAAVHDVLAARSGGRVPAADLLAAVVAAGDPDATAIDVGGTDLTFPHQQAQHVGVLVNELLTNAHRHGVAPYAVTLAVRDGEARLTVADAGPGVPDAAWSSPGLGLRLVRQVAVQGLGGRLERQPHAVAVCFRVDDDAHPGR
jgi:two-component sensor histidine kinase